MRPSFRSLAPVFSSFVLFAALALSSGAQSAKAVATSARILAQVNTVQTTRLKGHIPAWATTANDRGQLDRTRRLDNLHLTLTRAPQVEAAFQQLLIDQQNPASPRYHQWLTPQQNAEQYGIAASDLAAVTGWLRSQGLSVDDVTAGGVFITFSGPVPSVENAFSVNLHNFSQEGVSHYAPTEEPAVPAALSGVITAINGIAETSFRSQAHSFGRPIPAALVYPSSGTVAPDFNLTDSSGVVHLLSPGDFNLIYDVNSVLNAGITGTGNRVAVLGASAITAADITAYENLYGLPAQQPVVKVPPSGTSPGATGDSNQDEATLDVDRVIGTAPGAGVDLLIMKNGLNTANIMTLLQYNISTLNDPVQNLSFGLCEKDGGTANTQSLDSIFSAAQSQGISTFVSSGDTGAAGCDTNSGDAPASQFLSINLLCASSHVTCVGATEFADFTDPSQYWSAANSKTEVSALRYIPEGSWNELPTDPKNNEYEPSASGGGVSVVITKPSFQTGTGVPNDGFRDVPDLALAGSTHNAYVICESFEGTDCSSTFSAVGGTSAAAPSMAGIVSLLDQKLGARQGNVNPLLYQLAATPSNNVFHDVTVATSGVTSCILTTPSMCNNSTPGPTTVTGGLQGYEVSTGYDLATGLGSLDVANFLTAAAGGSSGSTSASFTLTPSSATLTLAPGATTGNTDTITLTSTNGFPGSVTFTCTIAMAGGGTAQVPPICPTPATASVTNGKGSSLVTINTQAQSSSCNTDTAQSYGRSLGIGLAGLLLLALPLRKRKSVRALIMAFLLVGGLTWMTGCSSSASKATQQTTPPCTNVISPATTAGTYTVTITGTSGSTSASTTFSLTIS